ncbi:hypothetical protein YB2330_006458 [Saitoella coloradoensis]
MPNDDYQSSPRNLLITSADGQTGHLLAELLLDPDSADDFHAQVTSLTCLTLDPSKCSDLEEAGATIVEHVPGDKDGLVQAMKEGNIDTVVIIPPAKDNKMEIFKETFDAAVEAGTVVNTILLSSAGIDYADPKKHPRLTEFKEMEHTLMLRGKMHPDSETGNSPCIVRAGFYAENLLLYTKMSPELPLPVSEGRAFAPLALGDLSLLLAHIAVGRGPHGLSDQHRGQLIIMTGPAMQTPTELAKTASEHAGKPITYTQSTPAAAKKLLENNTDLDAAEIEYLLEYWDLVEGGFTGYVSTHAFHDITGERPQEMGEWWEIYGGEFGGGGKGQPERKRRRTMKAKAKPEPTKKEEDEVDLTEDVDEEDDEAEFEPDETVMKGADDDDVEELEDEDKVIADEDADDDDEEEEEEEVEEKPKPKGTKRKSNNPTGKNAKSAPAKEAQREGGRKGGKASASSRGKKR